MSFRFRYGGVVHCSLSLSLSLSMSSELSWYTGDTKLKITLTNENLIMYLSYSLKEVHGFGG